MHMRSNPATSHPRRSSRLMCSNVLISLAVVFALLWVQSVIRGYGINVYTEVVMGPSAVNNYTSHQRAWSSSHGRMWFAYVRAELIEESARHEKRLRAYYAPAPRGEKVERYDAPKLLARLGIDWKRTDNSSVDAQGHYVYREILFCVPYWLLTVLAGGIGWSIGRKPRRTRGRIKRGLCIVCGYDVRATPGRCPECGYVAGERHGAAAASASA
jgi:hypothetical protein